MLTWFQSPSEGLRIFLINERCAQSLRCHQSWIGRAYLDDSAWKTLDELGKLARKISGKLPDRKLMF